jgi:hypothetical protein
MIAFLKSNPQERFAQLDVKDPLTSFNNLFLGVAEGGSSYEMVASGGARTSGSAANSYTVTYVYAPSGGAKAGGAASSNYSVIISYVASGGTVASGSAQIGIGYICQPSGGCITSGTAESSMGIIFTMVASGGTIVSGDAVYSIAENYPYIGSGGVLCGGSATAFQEVWYTHITSGGAVTGGTAAYQIGYGCSGEGGAVCSGEALCFIAGYGFIASGGMGTGGIASTLLDRFYLASGGAKTEGFAMVEFDAIGNDAPFYKQMGIKSKGDYTLVKQDGGLHYIRTLSVINRTKSAQGRIIIASKTRTWLSANLPFTSINHNYGTGKLLANSSLVVTTTLNDADLEITIGGFTRS